MLELPMRQTRRLPQRFFRPLAGALAVVLACTPPASPGAPESCDSLVSDTALRVGLEGHEAEIAAGLESPPAATPQPRPE